MSSHFKAAKKVLCHGVVIRIALTGHALTDREIGKTIAKGSSGILDTVRGYGK